MNGNMMGAFMGAGLLVALIGLVIGVVIYALILMFAYKIVVKSNPGFGKSIVATLAIFGASIVVGLVVGLLLGWLGMLGRLVVWVANFLVAAWLIQKLMKDSASGEISYGRACGVEGVAIGISIAIGLVLAILFAVLGVSFLHGLGHY